MKTKKVLVIVLVIALLMVVCIVSNMAIAAPQDATYYSNSVFLDGTYDIGRMQYAWKPVDLPGYQIDTSRGSCVGYIRINNDTFACTDNDGSWTWDEILDRWYFTNDNIIPTVCGNSNVQMQPWLYVYNPVTGAHDTIYGSILAVDWSWCKDIELPLVIKGTYYQQQVSDPYPMSESMQQDITKKDKKHNPYP